MRSSSSARNSSAPKLSKLLPLRLSSKWRLLAASWSRRPATARFTTSMSHPKVTYFCILLHMRPACLRWPLPPATRSPKRDRSSTLSLLAPLESLNVLESHVPRWRRPWLHRSRRRFSTQTPLHRLRLLPLLQTRKLCMRCFNSRHMAPRCHWPRLPRLRLSQLYCLTLLKPPAEKRPQPIRP